MFVYRAAVAFCAAIAGVVLVAVPAGGSVGSAGRAHERSFMYIAGYSRGHGLILNDFDNARVLAVRPDGSHLRVLRKDAQATAVVGGLIEYFRPSQQSPDSRSYFFDLDNGRHGVVPRKWMSLTDGGGVWVERRHNGWHLHYQPDTGTRSRDFGVMSDLPNVHPMYFNFAASPRGLLVIASFKSNRRAMTEFYPVPNAPGHHRLSTHGIARSTFLLCPHVGATIGCTDDTAGRYVIGLSRHRSRVPFVRHVAKAVGDVVFANESPRHQYAYTTLDDDDPDNGPQCPCSVHFDNGVTINRVVDAALATHGKAKPAVFYVRRTAHGSALYRSEFGRGHPALILRAPRVH